MPRSPAIATDLAEAALAQLVLRTADHRALAGVPDAIPVAPRGRHLHNKTEMRHHNALTDLVAVAEHFTAGLLLRIRPAVTADDVSSWEKRRAAWKKHASVDLASSPSWLPLLGFVEARNSLQHGLGRLTDRQLGKHRREVLAEIAAAGLHLNGDQLVITSADVENCVTTCADFVRYVDAAAPHL